MRKNNELRKIQILRNFTKHAAGSVLIKWGDTWVLCTASVEEKVPPFLRESGRGWVTAEYSMLPSSTGGGRKERDIKKLKMDARSSEIQRLIGRSLRAAVDLTKLGERQIVIDCDVLQADGGTRCASITGGMVALEIAVEKLLKACDQRESDSSPRRCGLCRRMRRQADFRFGLYSRFNGRGRSKCGYDGRRTFC